MDHLPDPWLLDSLFDGVLLLDGEGQIRQINRSAAALLQLERSEAGGRRPEEVLPALPALWLRLCAEALERREVQPLPEARIALPQAGERVLEGAVHPAPSGTGVALVLRDVTEREQAEERLRLRDRAMAASSNGIVLTDATAPDNPIIYVNPAFEEITGYPAEEILGRNCRFLQGEDREQPALEQLRQAIAGGRACDVVLRNYRKDGTLFWNELHVSPVRDEQGRVTHFLGIQQDISERRRFEEELVQRNEELKGARDELQVRNLELAEATRTKDRFTAMMSHEMRTPLNAILGYIELLDMGLSGELTEMQRYQIGRIRATGQQLLQLINDVLDLTRAEVAGLDLELRAVNLAAVIEEALILIEPEVRAKGLELRSERLEECPLVVADVRRLRQVLTNLLSNAVKFTERGAVTVSCRGLAEERVQLEIRDTGIGISAEELPRIFAEFYQVDSGLTREHGGTGLGLAIARRLARLMGGEVSVSSQPGQGSTFTLELRVASAQEEEGARPAEAPAPARAEGSPEAAEHDASRRPVVVVFGGSGEALERLAAELRPSVRVLGTTDAEEVTAIAARERATLVVLDVACDNGIGWKAAHALRENPRLDETAVLLLPCLPQLTSGELPGAIDLGLVAVVPKSLSEERFAHEVERAGGAQVDEASAEGSRMTRADGEHFDVLVVDDDPDARRIAARVLESAGARVRLAPDGESGLAEMRRQRPDVAVLDLMMPVLDGFGVLAAMRADPTLRDIPVVVLTAKDLSEDERRFLARTAERVLQKGEHRLSDVASLILRATEAQRESGAAEGAAP